MDARVERGDGGQVVPLVALGMALAGLVLLWLGRLGGAAVARAEARTAADAAALAGAVDGRDAARSVAADNGARLMRFESRGDEAFVAVSVGSAVATARARAGGTDRAGAGVGGSPRSAGGVGAGPCGRGVGGGSGGAARGCVDAGGLTPAMQAALAQAAALLGRTVPITSGYRSRAEQERLWTTRATNPFPVARPGYSAHERGVAVDVPLSFVAALESVAGRAGLCHPYPAADPVHFELCP